MFLDIVGEGGEDAVERLYPIDMRSISVEISGSCNMRHHEAP